MRWLDTRESWQWMLEHWKRIYHAAGVTTADCLYFAFSFGPFLGFWTAYEAACQTGCRSLPGGGLSSLARLQAMLDNQATALLCTPTYALRLAEVAAQESFDLARLAIRTIIVAGEPGGSVPAVRQRIEQAWPRAVICDHHGMTEVGPVTYQHRDRPGLLSVIESSYLAEVTEPGSNVPASAGEVGELVLTTLGRIGAPLIRYRTGDLVRQSPESLDGNLTLQGGILGRIDDMLVVRGVNIFPSAVEELMNGMAEIAHYQIEVDARGPMVELRLIVEPASTWAEGDGLAHYVEARVRAAFNLRIPVQVVSPGALPRGEMKTKRWLHKK